MHVHVCGLHLCLFLTTIANGIRHYQEPREVPLSDLSKVLVIHGAIGRLMKV